MIDPQGNRPRWQRYGFALLIALAAFGVVFVAAQVMGLIALRSDLPDAYPWGGLPTAGPGLSPPLTPFAHVNPAVVAALERDPGTYSADPLAVLGGGVPPVGAYLPQTGSTPFEPPATLPPPTLAPLPTTALIEQAGDTGIRPTEPGSSGPGAMAYGGDNCAPRGLPVGGLLTQRFHQWHSGIDLGVPVGTPVTATHSARVLFAGWSEIGYGNLIILQNGAFITYYGHLSEIGVTVDQLVGAGSVIGFSGNTGNSTGPHLHYETRINDVPVDPLTFENRGYGGC